MDEKGYYQPSERVLKMVESQGKVREFLNGYGVATGLP